MKIKMLKDRHGYKAGQEIELEEKDAKEFIDGKFAEAVEVDELDEALKGLDAKIAKAAEDAATKAATAVVEKINKGVRRPSIYVGNENVNEDPKKGFKNLGDFANAVRKSSGGEMDVRLKATGASVGTDADGGYAVPDVWAQQVYTDIVSGADLFSRTFNIPMSGTGSTLKIPADNITTLGSNGLVGRQFTRAQDGTAITVSKPQMREISIDVNREVILAPVTDDLLADGIAMEAYLQKLATLELNYRLNSNILRGGTCATGIINHAATVTVGRTTSNRVVFDDLRGMWARRYGRPGSFGWIINQEVESELMDIEDGSGRNLYFAPGTLPNNPNGVLFGAPVLVSEHSSSLGVEGDVVLASLENYITVSKGGVQFAMSSHLYFNTAEQAFRWTFRYGGKPARAAVITPASGQGTHQLSPFVQLDDHGS